MKNLECLLKILFLSLVLVAAADKHESKYSRKANSKDTDRFEKYDSDFR